MEKLKNKKVIVAIVAVIVVVGAVIGGVAYNNAQKQAAEEAALKKEYAGYEKLYQEAEENLENALIEEEVRTEKSTELASYQDGIKNKNLSDKQVKEFKALVKEIEELYQSSAEKAQEQVAALSQYDGKEDGYYTDEFLNEASAAKEEIAALQEEGKYQEAAEKTQELNDKYAAYVTEKDAQIAAEEAAQKAAEEEAKKKAEEEAKKSSSSNSNSNKTTGSSSSGSSSSSSSSSGSSSSGSSASKNPLDTDGNGVVDLRDYTGVKREADGKITLEYFNWVKSNGLCGPGITYEYLLTVDGYYDGMPGHSGW